LSHEIHLPQEQRPWKEVERNMSRAVKRGPAILPGSKNTSRAKGTHRKLGDPAPDQRRCYALVRIGKARSQSR
jgi:hypothetical protein